MAGNFINIFALTANRMTTSDVRKPGLLSWIAWIVGGWFVAFTVTVDFRTSENGVIRHAEVWGRDFINLWTGGKLIAARDYATLYTPQAFSAFQESIFGKLDLHVYSYPPTAFPLASVLSLFAYPVALALWLVCTGGLFLWAAMPWWPRNGGPYWLAILTPAALVNLWIGNYGFVFGSIFLLAFRRLDDRPVLAGAIIGLFAMKPQLAVLIPLVLLIRRDWHAIISAAISTATMILASGAIYGWGAWHEFLTRATGKQVSVIDAHGAFFGKMSASAATAILDLGGGWTLAIIGQGLWAALGIGLVSVAAWRRVRTDQLALLLATCTFLVLPYSINYDLVVVCIGAWVVMADSANRRLDRTLATLGFIAPQVGLLFAMFHLPITSLMLAGLAIAQFRVAIGRDVPIIAGAAHSA
jgi:alpha-1,2-mannosyltransferase